MWDHVAAAAAVVQGEGGASSEFRTYKYRVRERLTMGTAADGTVA